MLVVGGMWQVPVEAQAVTNVTIAGTSDNAAGKRIELYGYSDMLTQTEVLLDEYVVDSAGRFELRCYTNYPRLVFVQAENYSQSFYIEPGRVYKMHIAEFDWSIDEQRNVNLAPEALPLLFQDLPADELNLRIGRFEEVVDSFIAAKRVFFDLKFKPQKRYYDTLVAELGRRGVRVAAPGSDGETFFDRYANSSLASLQHALHFASRAKLIRRYIEGQPVRYYDEQYMRLFFDLYAGSISKGTKKIGKHRLEAWVHKGDIVRYLDSVGVDPLLRNEQLRELAVLEALKESYFDKDYHPEEVLRMIVALGEQTKFADHRVLAESLQKALTRLEVGSEVPDFRLPDVDRREVSLDSLRGKWVYLSFVRVGDPHCVAELETMAHFRDTVYARSGGEVVFVSVCCDREFQKMYHLLKNSKRGRRYGWTWLHIDGNYRLLEHYGVVSYPTFVLINPEGRRHYNVTPAPASGILLRGPWEKAAEEERGTVAPFLNGERR